jgi:hypothetical protein
MSQTQRVERYIERWLLLNLSPQLKTFPRNLLTVASLIENVENPWLLIISFVLAWPLQRQAADSFKQPRLWGRAEEITNVSHSGSGTKVTYLSTYHIQQTRLRSVAANYCTRCTVPAPVQGHRVQYTHGNTSEVNHYFNTTKSILSWQ